MAGTSSFCLDDHNIYGAGIVSHEVDDCEGNDSENEYQICATNKQEQHTSQQ